MPAPSTSPPLKNPAPEAPLVAAPLKRRLIGLLRAAAAIAIIIVLVRGVGVDSLLASLRACPPSIALAAFVLAMAWQWVAAWRLSLLARSQDFALAGAESMLLTLSSTFYGLFVPGGTATGWAVRLVRLSRGTGRIAPGLQLLGGDRALSTASGAAIGLLAVAAIATPTPAWVSLLLLGVAGGSGLLCLALFAPTMAKVLSLTRRLPLADRVIARLQARSSLLRRPDPGTVALSILLSVVAHLLGVLAWLLLARAVGIDVSPVTIAWVRSASMVATLLPATVGGLGLREGAVVYLLALFGTSAHDALALSLLVFATTIVPVGVIGGLFEARDLLRLRR